MDGIYSAAREVDETSLFTEALRLAGREVTRQLSSKHRQYAERAVKKARGYGRRFSVSHGRSSISFAALRRTRSIPESICISSACGPSRNPTESQEDDGLDVSRMFVDRLLGTAVSGLTPASRIEALRLLNPSEQQIRDLEAFLALGGHKAASSRIGGTRRQEASVGQCLAD